MQEPTQYQQSSYDILTVHGHHADENLHEAIIHTETKISLALKPEEVKI